MSGRATNDALDALHGLLAEGLTEDLRRNFAANRLPKFIPDPDGGPDILNPKWEPLSVATVREALKLLKDNGIDAPAAATRFDGLVDQLSKMDVGDDQYLAN